LIDVTPQDFLKLHNGLVRMLQALAEAGPSGLSTNKASLQVFNSRTYGWRILTQAEELGYIERKQMPRPNGGHPYTMNSLTPKGRKLLQELGR
jgi:DNA-binding MarR family transcriptional regulator